jgi:hypothetical protein
LVLGVTPATVIEAVPFLTAKVFATFAPDGALQLTRMTFEVPAKTAFMVDFARLPETTQGSPGSAQVVWATARWLEAPITPRVVNESVVANPRSTKRERRFAVEFPESFEAFDKTDDSVAGKLVMAQSSRFGASVSSVWGYVRECTVNPIYPCAYTHLLGKP